MTKAFQSTKNPFKKFETKSRESSREPTNSNKNIVKFFTKGKQIMNKREKQKPKQDHKKNQKHVFLDLVDFSSQGSIPRNNGRQSREETPNLTAQEVPKPNRSPHIRQSLELIKECQTVTSNALTVHLDTKNKEVKVIEDKLHPKVNTSKNEHDTQSVDDKLERGNIHDLGQSKRFHHTSHKNIHEEKDPESIASAKKLIEAAQKANSRAPIEIGSNFSQQPGNRYNKAQVTPSGSYSSSVQQNFSGNINKQQFNDPSQDLKYSTGNFSSNFIYQENARPISSAENRYTNFASYNPPGRKRIELNGQKSASKDNMSYSLGKDLQSSITFEENKSSGHIPNILESEKPNIVISPHFNPDDRPIRANVEMQPIFSAEPNFGNQRDIPKPKPK